jgi:hypothetical protein
MMRAQRDIQQADRKTLLGREVVDRKIMKPVAGDIGEGAGAMGNLTIDALERMQMTRRKAL